MAGLVFYQLGISFQIKFSWLYPGHDWGGDRGRAGGGDVVGSLCTNMANCSSDTSDTCTMIIMINIHHRQSRVTTTPDLQMVGNGEKILNCQPGISMEQLGDDKFLFDQSRVWLTRTDWLVREIYYFGFSSDFAPSIWQPLTHLGSTLLQLSQRPSPLLRWAKFLLRNVLIVNLAFIRFLCLQTISTFLIRS